MKVISILLLALPAVSAFAPTGNFFLRNSVQGLSSLRSARSSTAINAVTMQQDSSRRVFLKIAAAGAAFGSFSGSADATVYFDTERYGDKELKVAIINQVKQQFRALYEKKPELIVPLFQLVLADALTFDPKSGEGGVDGGILRQQDDARLAYLKPAFAEVTRIRNDLVAKSEISNADLIAFAGATAIEATGGGRVKIQLGRIDGKKLKPDTKMWDPTNPTAQSVKEAITSTGLSAQDGVLLASCIGQLRLASKAMKVSQGNKVACNPDEEECNTEEEGYYGIYSPVTIVSETNKQFGKKRGASAVNSNTGFDSARIAGLAGDEKFSNSFLADIAKTGGTTPLGKALMGDDETKKWVLEYAKGNSRKYLKDVEKAYEKLVDLGRSNTNK